MAALETREPSLARFPGHRLGDGLPYFTPAAGGGLSLFLCRWDTERPLRVSLPSDATESELDAIRLALAAWEDAGLGVRFALVAGATGRADITLRFPDPESEDLPAGVGDTIADCALRSGFAARGPARVGPAARGPASRVDARLVFASIELRRVLYDVARRPSEVSPEQLLAALLHELGHALGFPGHARSRDSVMTSAAGEVRRIGARVLAGKPFRDATLSALYGLPNGVVVGRLDVAPEKLAPALRFAGLAKQRGLQGPFVRVGDESARLLWREPGGRAAGSFVARAWRAAQYDPERFELQPTLRALSLLGSSE